MARTARPSDVYRLPEQPERPPRPADQPGPHEPSPRHLPAWMAVAGVLAVILVVSGLTGGATAPTTGDAPLVDVVSEDQAIAALALYGTQARTIDMLRDRQEIFAPPGPGAAAGVAARGAEAVRRALDAARAVDNPDALFTAYVGHDGHPRLQQSFANASARADSIALLAATHDSIYSGTGAIGVADAYERMGAVVSGGDSPRALQRWGVALQEQIENRPRLEAALAGRAETERFWSALVRSLQPAAVAQLQTYISGLPADTVDGLRGHPVAGPALERLEHTSRQVSTH